MVSIYSVSPVGSPVYRALTSSMVRTVEVLKSLNKVRNQTGNFDQIFEDGTKNSNTDLQNIFNDKETDKRNG